MPALRGNDRNGQPVVYPLHRKLTSIGCSSDCDIVLADETVADVHCHIHFDGHGFQLATMGKAKVQVNERWRGQHPLRHGDRLRIGGSDWLFTITDDEPSEPRAEASALADPTTTALRTFFDFSSKLLGQYELGELLESLMDAVLVVTRAQKAFFVLFEQGSPQVRVARNLNPESVSSAVEQLNDAIIAKVVRTRQALVVSDALRDSELGASYSILRLSVKSVMCVPLVDQETLLGLIYVGNESVLDAFDRTALDLLTAFAAQASLIVKNALLINSLRLDNQQLARRLEAIRFGSLIGSSAAMREVYRTVEKVATTDISVLITGETGTGKELIATELHQRSSRSRGPFVSINCGAIPENLLESELFGHVKGAFTGAVSNKRGKFHVADGGTLFLDEIGELPLHLQVKLLRALQEKSVVRVGDSRAENVDIRVIAATNRPLEQLVRRGEFREDLYYRINVVNIHLPPLRERGEDIVVLAHYLLNKYAEEFGRPVRGFSPEALSELRKHSWPGNIRQLENHIKKAIVLAEKPLLSGADLDLSEDELTPILPLAQAKEEFQRRYINEVLALNNGNRTKTARDLSVDPRTIFRHLEKDDEGATP